MLREVEAAGVSDPEAVAMAVVERELGREPTEEDLKRFDDVSCLSHLKLGSRCQVSPGERRGVVAFLGEVEGKRGFWAGIQLDEPDSKGDGTHGGKRYFVAEPRFGAFVRGDRVETGDFPPLADAEMAELLGESAEGAEGSAEEGASAAGTVVAAGGGGGEGETGGGGVASIGVEEAKEDGESERRVGGMLRVGRRRLDDEELADYDEDDDDEL